MIEGGQNEALVDFAKENPGRVGALLGNYRIVFKQWEQNDPRLLRELLTLTWDRLDDATRRQFLHIMLRMIYRVSKSAITSSGVPTGESKSRRFEFQADEIDLDRTIEALTQEMALSHDTIYVLDRERRRRAVVIMMDASGSVRGINLSMAAVGAASLVLNLNHRDEYGVVLFSDSSNIFKHIGQAKKLDQVIRGILDIIPRGRTDISLGLSVGLGEIRRARVEQREGILLTDGWQNSGKDPVAIARKFPKLHVINVPGGNVEVSKKIAKAGRGRLVSLRGLCDVPKAIAACLD
ncbi:VWA domain-containing protein [candidate division KSB1 bacterium]|nr:VWA domain-containing protein [candidate division KSB1 bacterium]